MYIFKYHPDNVIYMNNTYKHTYVEFIALYPDFPIIEGHFFEYGDNKLDSIDSQGHHLTQDLSLFEPLIVAIGDICGI